jgi:hypothetical protein
MKELLFIGLMLWSFPFLEVTGQEFVFIASCAVLPIVFMLMRCCT